MHMESLSSLVRAITVLQKHWLEFRKETATQKSGISIRMSCTTIHNNKRYTNG